MAKADRLVGLGMPSALANEVTSAPTATDRGGVLRQPNVAGAAGANPTKAEYATLLAALEAAGILTPA